MKIYFARNKSTFKPFMITIIFHLWIIRMPISKLLKKRILLIIKTWLTSNQILPKIKLRNPKSEQWPYTRGGRDHCGQLPPLQCLTPPPRSCLKELFSIVPFLLTTFIVNILGLWVSLFKEQKALNQFLNVQTFIMHLIWISEESHLTVEKCKHLKWSISPLPKVHYIYLCAKIFNLQLALEQCNILFFGIYHKIFGIG